MSSFRIFPFSAKPLAELKVHSVKNLQQWLLKIILSGIGILCVVFQAHATNPAPAASASAATPAAAPATTSAASGGFDKSKVPPVTAASRPGLFMLPPTGPGYYSFWDMLTGNKREKPPVAPYAPFALLTTPAYDIDFRYLDTAGHEKDVFDPIKRMHLGDDWLLSFGGNFWYRYIHETDSRLNAAGTNNDSHM